MEKALFIESIPRLFGMLFLPEPEQRKTTGFVVVHPFAEEKKSAHRTLVNLSRQLCHSGFSVLMFDLRGCGDSDGNFASVHLTDWLADIETAIATLCSHVSLSGVGLIGLRFGAYLSLYCALQHADISESIWIEPVLHPLDYLRKSLRHKLIKELYTSDKVVSNRDNLLRDLQQYHSIDFDGYEIGAGLYQDLVREEKEQTVVKNWINIRNGLLVSVSMGGRPTKSAQKVLTLRPDMKHVTIKMELFWNKVDEADDTMLITEIHHYVVNHCV